ncbi:MULTISPECIES: hypothetical protein [Frankia]|uniref:hypothetical protein n=1 Tax=Frankia TaxID=1854 RepID=UPI00030D3672|nr:MULTISPECIES: hypothetical protein [Frankia]
MTDALEAVERSGDSAGPQAAQIGQPPWCQRSAHLAQCQNGASLVPSSISFAPSWL